MRLSITWLILIGVGLSLGLLACGGSQPAASTPVGATSAESRPTQPTENKLPPPVVSIATPAPIPTAAKPKIVTASENEAPVATATPIPLTEVIDIDGVFNARRVGNGAFKVVLVTDRHPVIEMMAEAYSGDPASVPENLSLWFITTGESGDLLRSADTSFDNCPRNDGRARPFNSAESFALRNFLADAAFATFFEVASANVIHNDACAQHALADSSGRRLAEQANTLAQSNGLPGDFSFSPLPRVIGHYVDYLAGEGIGALTIGLAAEDSAVQRGVIESLVNGLSAELSNDAVWLADDTIDKWTFSAESIIHPIAIVQHLGIIYILDSGRILAVDPNFIGGTLVSILAGGDTVEETRVLELLDLSSDGEHLYALDRAGDVYRYSAESGIWQIDRYDRPIRDRSAHYFTALAARPDGRRHLLETSAPLMLRYADDEKRSTLPDSFYPVDVSVSDETALVLLHDKESPTGEIWRYELGDGKGAIRLSETLVQPRQLVATSESLFVLDRDGKQIQQFDAITGQRIAVYRFTDNRPISSLWTDGKTLLLAGRDALYLLGEGADSRRIDTDHLIVNNRPHDTEMLSRISNFSIPIGIPNFIQRDYQMAGAPRHYRLGVHEGFDFYWQRGSQIQAATAGTVIRADWEYVPPYAEQFTLWRDQSFNLGYTSPEATEFFSGRQVWIENEDGLQTRYLHLSSIDYSVVVGATVERGQVIARVGNSGSPGMLVSENEDAHLHFEIRLGDADGTGYLGQYLRPIEAREWLRRILR